MNYEFLMSEVVEGVSALFAIDDDEFEYQIEIIFGEIEVVQFYCVMYFDEGWYIDDESGCSYVEYLCSIVALVVNGEGVIEFEVDELLLLLISSVVLVLFAELLLVEVPVDRLLVDFDIVMSEYGCSCDFDSE